VENIAIIGIDNNFYSSFSLWPVLVLMLAKLWESSVIAGMRWSQNGCRVSAITDNMVNFASVISKQCVRDLACLGAVAARCAGSSPVSGTMFHKQV
jgi:hypothetical protein